MVNLSFVFPTQSECKNIDPEHIARFYHFICHNKQVVIQKVSRGYVVLANGFRSVRSSNYRADDWYTIKKFDDLPSAEKMFRDCVVDILVSRYYNRELFDKEVNIEHSKN